MKCHFDCSISRVVPSHLFYHRRFEHARIEFNMGQGAPEKSWNYGIRNFGGVGGWIHNVTIVNCENIVSQFHNCDSTRAFSGRPSKIRYVTFVNGVLNLDLLEWRYISFSRLLTIRTPIHVVSKKWQFQYECHKNVTPVKPLSSIMNYFWPNSDIRSSIANNILGAKTLPGRGGPSIMSDLVSCFAPLPLYHVWFSDIFRPSPLPPDAIDMTCTGWNAPLCHVYAIAFPRWRDFKIHEVGLRILSIAVLKIVRRWPCGRSFGVRVPCVFGCCWIHTKIRHSFKMQYPHFPMKGIAKTWVLMQIVLIWNW